MFAFALLAQLTWTVTDVNPNRSTMHATDPGGATGGRVHNLAGMPDGRTFFAASEWGGLYRSSDAGRTWAHVPGHLPQVMWDVAVDPRDPQRMYATSFYDGRVVSRSGISVSTDGGVTWNKPATAVPPPGFCSTAARRDDPSAYGISIMGADSSMVVIGTSCGVAISRDSGATWTFADPTPGDAGAGDVWDVLAQTADVISVCGADGFRRSLDGGATWSGAVASPLPSGRCSIAASPDERDVLFAVVGTTLYESIDGGATWPHTFVNRRPQGRVPFVLTNQRPGPGFDLWFGDVNLWRAECTSAIARGMRRCPEDAWLGPYDRNAGGHPDVGDLAFVAAGEDDCPLLFANDGGVNINTKTLSPACHDPFWTQPDVSPHALWPWAMGGADQPGVESEDLYFGTQDNGGFATRDASAPAPAWSHRVVADVFETVADSTEVLFTVCCNVTLPRWIHLYRAGPGMVGATNLSNTLPEGEIRGGFHYTDGIARYGPGSYAILTGTGVYTTEPSAPGWKQIGTALIPRYPAAIQAAVRDGTPVFFTISNNALGRHADELWHNSGGTWQKMQPPGGAGGFAIAVVDPKNPDRIIASHLRTGVTPQMVMTHDRGVTWNAMPALDALMTGNGEFRYQNTRGPTEFISQIGYPQPTMAAFDPDDANIVVAGGADSGFFASVDGGASWTMLTRQIPRPRFAYFDHESTLAGARLFERVNIYVGSQGRGIWRIALDRPRPDLVADCRKLPSPCVTPKFDGEAWYVRCGEGSVNEPGVRCIARLPFGNACSVLGCTLCRRRGCRYTLSIEGLDPDLWYFGITDASGNPAPEQELEATTGGVRLSFRVQTLTDYQLLLVRKSGAPGAEYAFRMRFVL